MLIDIADCLLRWTTPISWKKVVCLQSAPTADCNKLGLNKLFSISHSPGLLGLLIAGLPRNILIYQDIPARLYKIKKLSQVPSLFHVANLTSNNFRATSKSSLSVKQKTNNNKSCTIFSITQILFFRENWILKMVDFTREVKTFSWFVYRHCNKANKSREKKLFCLLKG